MNWRKQLHFITNFVADKTKLFRWFDDSAQVLQNEDLCLFELNSFTRDYVRDILSKALKENREFTQIG